MSDLSTIQAHTAAVEVQVRLRLERGMAAWGVGEPLSLDEWAQQYFYLSAESSYVEQRWTPWTFQRGIMACISNDDIYEIDLKKSARVGYTKVLLATICYYAHHKHRNQAIWQPTDEDRDEFVKAELDPVLRDIPVMRDVLPSYLARHKDNTLQQKKFIGSMAHMKGAKAAKNFRRISVDVAMLDEVDAMDRDVEKEGDPFTLACKRIEGATNPKVVAGSTPKLKGFSLIDERFALADERFTYQVPCPHCGERHALTWGGKDEPHGIKFTDRDPATARHLCPHCHVLIEQREYLAVEMHGVWINEAGTLHLHADGRFTTPDGTAAPPPRHVAFHVWTAYSPAVSWSQIVREFMAARAAMEIGDESKMKAWINTTRGECWEGEIERTDSEELKARAEPFPLRIMPRDCLLLLCGGDTQGNRLEAQVWGLGIGGQMWSIDHQVFYGSPAQEDVWLEFEDFLFSTTYQHADGTTQRIYATAIDSGGHHADAVYSFANKHRSRRVHAIKGSSGAERSIENGNVKVGFNWQGRRERHGPVLWHVGTHLAKDRFAARLEVQQPGPGYVHLSRDNTDEWFRQLAAEDRVTQRGQYGTVTRWVPNRKRNEIIDMTAYVIWLEERLDLWAPKKRKWWDELAEQVQPAINDLFAPGAGPLQLDSPRDQEHVRQEARSVTQTKTTTPPPPKRQQIARSDWSSRL